MFLGTGVLVIATALLPPARLLQADDGAEPVQAPATKVAGPLLLSSTLAPLNLVNQYLPEVTVEASTGADTTALGNPAATRAVAYTSSDGAQKVPATPDTVAKLVAVAREEDNAARAIGRPKSSCGALLSLCIGTSAMYACCRTTAHRGFISVDLASTR